MFDVDLTQGDERNEKNELELERVLAGAPTRTIRSERGSEGILPEVLIKGLRRRPRREGGNVDEDAIMYRTGRHLVG